MGLDVSHDCWRGAYSAFNRWRAWLAEAAGYLFATDNPGATVALDWGCIEGIIGDDLNGDWPAIPVRPDGKPDPLMILLAHSDCEGLIRWRHAGPLANRLEELLPRLEGIDGRDVGLMTDATRSFIAGLRRAAEAREDVLFS